MNQVGMLLELDWDPETGVEMHTVFVEWIGAVHSMRQ